MSVVGIDLGTTNTVVGCVRAGKVHVLADEKGVRLLPSVVSFHPNGEVLVGAAAKARRLIDAKNTIYSHKRLMGRSWNSPEITQARRRLPFELREGPGQGPLVHARGQDYTLPEISAFVLKRARQIAEQALGTPVERAVITVPAHFNELQRASTKVAGRVSGLEVLRILNEPTAAALAYGLGRSGNERVAVYDFGGGTFDCTLLDLNGNVFEVLATAGDSFLGGDDVDNVIADRMAEQFLAQHRQDARQDPALFERLKTAAEEMKIALSQAETHTVSLRDFGPGAVTFNFTMTRRDLEALVTPLIDRTFKVTQDALSLARLAPSSFDKVILVGGSTRMPAVRQRVEAFFGTKPLDRVNPDEVVAIGAAIQAAALTENTRRRSIPAPPGVPGRRPLDSRSEDTKTGELDPSMLKPAFGSAPPAFNTRRSYPPPPPSTRPGASAPPATKPSTRPGIAPPMTQPYGARGLLGQRPPAMDGDPATLTQGAHPDPVPAFGAIDEPPSLVSTPSASVPSFPSLRGAGRPSPPGTDPSAPPMPDGPFGEVPDLSLISTTGVSAPQPAARLADLSFGTPSSLEAETQARPHPLGEEDEGLTEAYRRPAAPAGGTVQLDPRRNPAAPRETVDPLLDRADLPSVVPKAKPARRPGEVGMGPGGNAAMAGRAPMPVAQQPFGPMERVSTEPMPARQPPPPAPTRPQGAFASTPPAPPPPAFGSVPPRAPGPFASSPPPMPPFASSPPPAAPTRPQGAFGSQAPPGAGPFGSVPPRVPGPYASAPPPPFASQPAAPFAFGSAPPPPPTTASGPVPAYGYPPAPAGPSGPMTLPPAAPGVQFQAPVLVDVTPRGLVVETAGGYSDTIIPRNSKIPCERTRKFATGRDLQTSVRIRVAQGESPTFQQNTYLGEVELSGLRPAPRGEVTVAVTFEVDADGTLRVRARDVQTGQEARAMLQLVGIADESSVVMMINRFAQQPVVGGPS